MMSNQKSRNNKTVPNKGMSTVAAGLAWFQEKTLASLLCVPGFHRVCQNIYIFIHYTSIKLICQCFFIYFSVILFDNRFHSVSYIFIKFSNFVFFNAYIIYKFNKAVTYCFNFCYISAFYFFYSFNSFIA